MKVSDEEVERLAQIARDALNNCPGTFDDVVLRARQYWQSVVRAILAELPEPTRPLWATPQCSTLLSYCRLIYDDNGREHPRIAGSRLEVYIGDWIESTKPKTVELPERWYCEIGTGLAGAQIAVVCFSEAEASAVRAHHYPSVVTVRHVQEGK